MKNRRWTLNPFRCLLVAIRCLDGDCTFACRAFHGGLADGHWLVDSSWTTRQYPRWARRLRFAPSRKWRECRKRRFRCVCVTIREYASKYGRKFRDLRQRWVINRTLWWQICSRNYVPTRHQLTRARSACSAWQKTRPNLKTVHTFRSWIAGCRARATEQGYGFDQLWIYEPVNHAGEVGKDPRRP